MKNNYIFQNKKKFSKKRGIIFTVSQICLMSGLIKDGWPFISTSAFNLL